MVPIRDYEPYNYPRGGDVFGIGSSLLQQPTSPFDTFTNTSNSFLNLRKNQREDRKGELSLEEIERQYDQDKRIREELAQRMETGADTNNPFSMEDAVDFVQREKTRGGDIEQALKLDEMQSRSKKNDREEIKDILNTARDMVYTDPEGAVDYYNTENPLNRTVDKPSQLRGIEESYSGDVKYRTYPDGRRVQVGPTNPRQGRSSKIIMMQDAEGNPVPVEYSSAYELQEQIRRGGLRPANEDPIDMALRNSILGRGSRNSPNPMPAPTPAPVPGVIIRKRVQPGAN